MSQQLVRITTRRNVAQRTLSDASERLPTYGEAVEMRPVERTRGNVAQRTLSDASVHLPTYGEAVEMRPAERTRRNVAQRTIGGARRVEASTSSFE